VLEPSLEATKETHVQTCHRRHACTVSTLSPLTSRAKTLADAIFHGPVYGSFTPAA
jgi:hypothetical protein